MDDIDNGSYQLIKKLPATTIKVRIWKLLKVLKKNKFLYYTLCCHLKMNDLFVARFYGQPKAQRLEVPIYLVFHIIAPHYRILTNA